MPFDIRQLRYAIAAADHGSFYRAARRLDVEQSTLSRAIQKLERSIGMSLFERSRAGVKTTAAGKAFIRGAKSMVASADNLVAVMRAAGQGRAGSLVVGHNSPISAGNLRAMIMSWRDAHPDLEVKSIEGDQGMLLACLDRGEVDIAFLIGTTGLNGFRCEPLWSERLLVALPISHRLAERNEVYWTDLRGEQVILPASDPGPEIRNMLSGRLEVSNVKSDIQMLQASRETVLSVLGGSSDISIVCEGSTGVRYPDIVYRAIYGEQGLALTSHSGCWRADNNNPALARFLAFIRTRFALNSL